MTKKDKRVIELKAQYRVLSEIEELWGVKPSNHRAYIFIQRKMKAILKEIQITT